MRLVILAAGLSTRAAAITGGRSKLFLDCAGATLLDRHLDLCRGLGGEPLVVTRPELASEFRAAGAEVLVEERPTGMIASLYHARGRLAGPFCWIGGDMVFSDLEPLVELARAHRAAGATAAFFHSATDRFKAKIRLAPRLSVSVTREGEHAASIPNFMAATGAIFPYMAADPDGNFLAAAIAAGEPLLLREYMAPVFEIDTPGDLAEASARLAGLAAQDERAAERARQ
jgi:molybdopterin-guanine dinucleotide biosynthesis protein A